MRGVAARAGDGKLPWEESACKRKERNYRRTSFSILPHGDIILGIVDCMCGRHALLLKLEA